MTSQFYKFASSLQERLISSGQCYIKVHKGLRKCRFIFLSDFYLYVLSQDKVKYKLSLTKIKKVIASSNSAEFVLITDDKSILIDNLSFRSACLKELNNQKYSIDIIYVKETLLDDYVEGQKDDARDQGFLINLRQLKNDYLSFGSAETKKKFDETYKIEECIHKDEYFSILIVSEIQNKENKKKRKSKEELKRYTVKIYNKQLIGQNKILLKQIFNEKKFLEEIMSFYVPILYKCTFSKTYVYCLTQFYSGETLESYLKNQTLDKKNLRLLLGQLVIALGQLHQCGLVYGNVNINGIFVTDKGYILLNDFSKCYALQTPPEEVIQEQFLGKEKHKKDPKQELIIDWIDLGKLIYFIKEGTEWKQDAPISEYKEKQLTNLLGELFREKVQQKLGFKNDYHEVLGHEYFKGVNSKQLATQKCDPLKKFFTVNYSNFSKENLLSYLESQDWSVHDPYLKDYEYSRELE